MSAPENDDLNWLRALGGHASARPDSAAAREAALLRGACRRQLAEDTVAQPFAEADALALMQRARADGVGSLQRLPQAGWWARAWQAVAVHPGRAGLVLAAVLAGLVAVPAGLLGPTQGEDPGALRSPNDVVLVKSASPRAERDRLAAELRAAGVDVHVYARLTRHGLDAELHQPVPAAVRQILAAHALSAPVSGLLRIEFSEEP